MIPEDWEVLNLQKTSILKGRIGWQGLTTSEYLDIGDYYLVTGTDFINNKIKWETCHFVEKSRYEQDTNIQLKVNDILITKDGTIGKIAFVEKLPGLSCLNSGVFVIRPKNNLYLPLFLFYILDSKYFKNFLFKLKAGSTISHLYQKDFIIFSFPVPQNQKEQAAIARVLSDMDAEIEALEQKKNKYTKIKQGMMSELLTGRIRLA